MRGPKAGCRGAARRISPWSCASASRTWRVDSARQFFLGGAAVQCWRTGAAGQAAPRRAASPFSSAIALAHRRAVEDGPPVVVGLAADTVDAESVRGGLAAADGAGQQAARAAAVEGVVSAGGSRPARRGPRRLGLNCVRKAAAAAWRGESGAGPDRRAARAGPQMEEGAARAVSPFHERRCSAALRGALHFSRCSSSSPCKIGLSQRGHGTSTDAHLRWHWGKWILRLWGK